LTLTGLRITQKRINQALHARPSLLNQREQVARTGSPRTLLTPLRGSSLRASVDCA
jgi:hypothetical protein